MTYQLLPPNDVIHLPTGRVVPITDPVYVAWVASGGVPYPADVVIPEDPPPPPDKKQETLSISQQMMASGFFKVQALMSINYFIDKIKALPAASGLTDEQIVAALVDPQSPFYNADFVKVQSYYNDLMAL